MNQSPMHSVQPVQSIQSPIRSAIVILLTFCTGCASVLRDTDTLENDPIVRAATPHRLITAPEKSLSEETSSMPPLSDGEITLGMSMKEVFSTWGQPTEIQLPDNSQSSSIRPLGNGNSNGNEKWIYSESLFPELKIRSSKIVYFEAGKVSGWEVP